MTPASLEVRSPVDGALLASVPVTSPESVRAAVAASRAAQASWAGRSPEERARVLRELARVMARRCDEIAGCVRQETGKPRAEALAEVLVSVDLLRYYARVAPRHLRGRRAATGWMVSKAAWVEREPLGVVGAITPWNYPFILVMDCVTPALFAGNGVVVKPSEVTPLSALLVPRLLDEAGVPSGLVQVVPGDGSTGRALVEAGVDRLAFTGSTATGRKVMAAAASTLTPVTLELGGKDAAIVLEDADLERAARGIVFGAFFNAGQTCISVERAYVVRSVYQPFVERVAELARGLRLGSGGDADVGPIISPAQLGILERHVDTALAGGARALCGGRRASGSSFFPPTVLVDVDGSMEVVREESFGPLLPVIAVRDEAEAVRLANATAYGLFASVWTRDRKRGLRVARTLRAGGVSVNDVLSHYGVPSLPMGGVGDSGFGRRRGPEALDDMTRTKTLFADRTGAKREFYWFPYSAKSARVMRALVQWRARGGAGGLAALIRGLLGKEI
ncbi:MAG: aldehyde dehydrogenase family protein [Gemmatimonadetes bacterium]|nr:aldehyde dehydrogenase family protein [Gemmatimonadota bacterium]